MKHFVLYTILFCIAFLNVPRTLVHDCDHHEVSVVSDDDSGVSLEQDECFVCEFQLDYFEVPQFWLPKFDNQGNVAVIVKSTQKSKVGYSSLYSLRGPPALV